jgi:thioredoxin reductase
VPAPGELHTVSLPPASAARSRIPARPKCPSRDDKGFVHTGADIKKPLETCLPGVFAIGDVRSGSIKRVAAAVEEGAQVVAALHAFLAEAGDKPALSISSGRP